MGPEDTKNADLRWKEAMILAQAGDENAYRVLLTEFSVYLRKFITKRFGPLEAMDDIVQETLLGIHKARHTFNPSLSFLSWSLAICRYKSADYFRARGSRKEFAIGNEQLDLFASVDENSLEEEGKLQQLKDAIETLPNTQKQILKFMKFEDLSVRETSERMKMSEGAVRVSAHRAYEFLKKTLLKGKK